MIAEECKKLRAQLEEVAKAEERETIVGQLEARHIELLELRDTVVSATTALNAMASRTEIVGKLDSTKAVERIRNVRAALKADPADITKGSNFAYLKSACQKFAEAGTSATEETWEQYKPKARPSIDMNQLAEAEVQESFKSTVAHLRARAKHADQIGKHPPATEEDFKALELAWEDIRRMISELPEVANDPQVRKFLKAANTRDGAPLELLTEEVRAWLQDNKVAEKYRIITIS